MAARAIAGTAYIKVDGAQYALRGNLTVSIASVEREGIAGQDGTHGFKEMPRVPFIQCDVSDGADVSIKDITDMKDVTVTAELINGKSYVLRNAWVADAVEIDSAEGQMTIKWEGMSGDEIL